MIFFFVQIESCCQVGAGCSLDVDVGMDLAGFEQTVQRAYFCKRSED
jgi:hypothetical protein